MEKEKEKKGQPCFIRVTPRPNLFMKFKQECKDKDFTPTELFNQMCRERYKL